MQSLKNQKKTDRFFRQAFLLGLAPLSLPALLFYQTDPHQPLILSACGTVLAMLGGGLGILFRNPAASRILICGGILLGLLLLIPAFSGNPLLALVVLLGAIAGLFALTTERWGKETPDLNMRLARLQGSAWALLLLTLLSPLMPSDSIFLQHSCLASLLLMSGAAADYWCCKNQSGKQKIIWRILLTIIALAGMHPFVQQFLLVTALAAAVIALFCAKKEKNTDSDALKDLLIHPARGLVLIFLMLCSGGTILLRTPAAAAQPLSIPDASFTAVSAVCVTGLSTIDVGTELTVAGRCFLLLLIQLGGLGIMLFSAMALHALGRLSMHHEQLLSELTQDAEQDIVQLLRWIVQFSLIVETVGALLLSLGFFLIHGDWLHAVQLGIFTSISAFCNAGFFPGADSLVPYMREPFILIVVALLIILGGISPAVMLFRGKWKKNRRLPTVSKMILLTTGCLLAGGTFLLALFEWNGIFQELSPLEKIVNAFFQSTTTRTAGFNSVPLGTLGIPAYLVMILWMFVGGSPGGTAGGIKTTTLAVLFLTFRTALSKEDHVVIDRHRITQQTIIQAIAVLMSAGLVLFLIVLMLAATQLLGMRALLFEAVSALATVGLSLGATGELDEVGRLIIMTAMFVGRIGPLTLFLLLSDRLPPPGAGYPRLKVPLG